MAKNEIAVIEKKVNPLVARSNTLAISDNKSLTEAVSLLSQMNKANDLIAAEKDKTYKPAYATVVAIRKQWKPLEEVFENAIGNLRDRISSYQTKQKKIADERTNKLAERAAKGTMRPETALRKMEDVDVPETTVSTEAGMVQFRTVPKFEVLDLKKLPAEYLLPNEPAIRRAMLANVELAGVRYYTEEVPHNSR